MVINIPLIQTLLVKSDSATTSNRQEDIIDINMASKEQDQQTQCKMTERLEAKMDY